MSLLAATGASPIPALLILLSSESGGERAPAGSRQPAAFLSQLHRPLLRKICLAASRVLLRVLDAVGLSLRGHAAIASREGRSVCARCLRSESRDQQVPAPRPCGFLSPPPAHKFCWI